MVLGRLGQLRELQQVPTYICCRVRFIFPCALSQLSATRNVLETKQLHRTGAPAASEIMPDRNLRIIARVTPFVLERQTHRFVSVRRWWWGSQTLIVATVPPGQPH
ncbi:hypothetical protein BJX96DRAFT_160713 [Aspergillus floccosus]